MKINTTKQMRLDELIKYMRENEIKVTEYVNNVGGIASFSYGQLSLRGESNFIDIESPFKVPVEEELTEETEFEELWNLSYNRETQAYHIIRGENLSVSESKGRLLIEGLETFSIYHKDTLIWSKDTGIPAEE